MSGDTPDGNGVEVPPVTSVETGQVQPVVSEVPQLPTAEANLVEELSDPQTPPIDIIRVAAENYPDEELTTIDQAIVDQAAADASAVIKGSDPLTYSPDKPPALIDRAKDRGPSKKNFKDGYATGGKSRMASDEDARPGIYEPDDTPDVPVSDQERADGFKDAAEAHAPLEPQLTDRQFATALLSEKKALESVGPEDPKYDEAQARIRKIDSYRTFVYSDKPKLGTIPRDRALPQLRKFMESGRMSIADENGTKDGVLTEQVVADGGDADATTASEAPAQESNPANSAEEPVPIKPISDEQLEAELAYLKAQSGNDVEHPLGRRIRAINNFIAVRNSDKSTINGIPKEEAVRQMREELTKGAVEVPKPESPAEVTSTSAEETTEELDALKGRLSELAAGGAEDKAGPAAEEPVTETPAAGEVAPIVDSDDTSAEVDPEMQRRMEMATELRQKVEAFRDSLIQSKEEGEELSPIESAKINALNLDLGNLSFQIENSRISDSQITIMSSKVEAYMQADSKEEIDAIRFPGTFESTLQAEAKKLTEQAKSEPDNAAIADRLKKIDEFKELPWFSGTPEQVQRQMALRKELLIPFDTGASGDAPEGVKVPLPTSPDSTIAESNAKAQELGREADKLRTKIENRVRKLRSYNDSDTEDVSGLKTAKIVELNNEIAFLDAVSRDGSLNEDQLRALSQRANLYMQADSIAEIDAIRHPGDFEQRLKAEANRLAAQLKNDPTNAALAGRLRKIADFTASPMYPPDPELVREQAALRKELVIPFDSSTSAEMDSDEDDDEGKFMPMVTVPGAKRESLLDRVKAGFNAGVDRYRARRRDKKAGEPAPADSMPLPPWKVDSAPGGVSASPEPVPPLRWSRPTDLEPSAPAPAVEPVPSSAVEDEPPADEPAPVEPTPIEPAPASPATSEQKLASMNLDNRLPLTKARADEALKLLQDRRDALRIDRIPAGERTAAEAARLKKLDREFPDALAADRKAREQAVTPVYSAEQSELKRLRDLRDTDKLPGDQLGRLDELETAESRYKLLSEKEKLTASEQKELDEMGDTWKDPALRAKEQEILDLADVSLESSADFAKFAEALQEYALRKQGKFHPALEAGIRMAVQEYFNRPDSGLTRPERNAMEQIQKLVKGMQQEIATLMTYKKSIEAQFDKQKQIVEQIKVSNKLVGGDMRTDDRTKQEEAHRLTQLYLQLASTNRVIRITKRRAEDANYNFQWRHRKVRKELGVQSLKDTMLGTWDDINRVFRFASRNFGVETDPVLSVRNKKLERP